METLTGAGVTVLVLGTVIWVNLMGASSWLKGEADVAAETDSQLAVRTICEQLRNAMWVSVSTDGNSISYHLPTKDSNGNFVSPVVWDGVFRKVIVSGSTLYIKESSVTTVLCKDVIATDPLANPPAPYVPFTAGYGAVTPCVTVEVATQQSGPSGKTLYGRNRETIYLRNLQETP